MAKLPVKITPVKNGRGPSKKAFTRDTFQNFLTRTGVGAGNINSAGRYGLHPISRNRLQIEWTYRGSWIVGTIVDCVAEDMTREGVEVQSKDSPEDVKRLEQSMQRLKYWKKMQQVIKWSRLYGGAVGYMMIDGADSSTPLDLDAVGKGQFRGVLPLDRWALFPSFNDLIDEQGPHIGEPRYYEMRPDMGTGLEYMKIHYSRLFRLVGVELPYWQLITENYWGQSVIERLWDRLIAFDSTTNGIAQLVYKAHLRTYKVAGLRKIIAAGGEAYDALVKQIEMIRAFQSNEGLTLMDAQDEFEVVSYGYAGLDEVLLGMGQQLAGASQIPLVRLFGQSPAGLNATGESDLRTYYDGILRQQESELREGVELSYQLAYRSEFGRPPPDDWSLQFLPLWQMDDEQRANVAKTTTDAILQPFSQGLTRRSTTLKELKQSSKVTGLFTNITDEEIKEADEADKDMPPGEAAMHNMGLDPETGQPKPIQEDPNKMKALEAVKEKANGAARPAGNE